MAVALENSQLRVLFLPEEGGKIASLVRLATGTEFLLQPHGFIDCFPTIAECGELHGVPWLHELAGGTVRMEASSSRYRFVRLARLDGEKLLLDYELTNLDERPFDYLWSARPLLVVEPGAQILLPWETRELMVDSSLDERLGRLGERVDWRPVTAVQPPEAGTDDKLYTPRLAQGFCALHRFDADESIAFRFDPALIPYVGLWLCQGGWPSGLFTVALQPSSGRPDSLPVAVERGEASLIAPGATQRWSLTIELSAGPPRE